MRIICDHCGYHVTGTVKKTPGNLNLHPECLALLSRDGKHELSTVSLRSGESSVSMLLERKRTDPNLSPDEIRKDPSTV